MRILFVHQNFPAQYVHLAHLLGAMKGCEVKALGDGRLIARRPPIPGVEFVGYPSPRGTAQTTHRYIRPLESALRRGQQVLRACMDLQKKGFTPDVIYAHPGWGEALFLKDVYPRAKLTLYCEFYYQAFGADVGFDPEFPAMIDDVPRVRVRNAANLLSLDAADHGISPTSWQRRSFPEWFRDRISVVHEGVDTDVITPRADARLEIPRKGITLTPRDQVVTYVARDLEPYRGFHMFMRAIPEIQRRRPEAHIVIVGGTGVSYGSPLPAGQTYKQKMLDELAGKLDLGRVHFLDKVPYPVLLNVYRVSSAHVYLTYPFVLSWSMLEAMSAGCAIVGSRTSPVEEIINDGYNGFLVDFFDPRQIAERVHRVLERHPETLAIRRNARATVQERFDLRRRCLPRHLELLGLPAARLIPGPQRKRVAPD